MGNSTRSVRRLAFQLPTNQSYQAGDHLAVYPENDKKQVIALFDYLDLEHDSVVSLEGYDNPIRLYDYLLRGVDLGAPLSVSWMLFFASKAASAIDQRHLSEMGHDDNRLETKAMTFSLFDILQKFPSVRLNLAMVMTILPRMKPRFYSISSSPLMRPNAVEITCGVFIKTTRAGLVHKGVCSII